MNKIDIDSPLRDHQSGMQPIESVEWIIAEVPDVSQSLKLEDFYIFHSSAPHESIKEYYSTGIPILSS